MAWSEIDGDWWTIPAERTKNGREHRIYLVPTVRDAIQGMPHEGRHVFERGRQWLAQCDWFRDLLAKANIRGAKFHDLRRTAATQMNKIGIDDVHVERVLNHVQGGVKGIYNRYRYDDEKRAALERWERRLNAIIAGEADKNVADLRRAG